MIRRVLVAITLVTSLLLTWGCKGGPPSVRLDDLVPMTADAICLLLVGPPADQSGLSTTTDPPLMKKGAYETALITADTEGFARESQGTVSVKSLQGVQKSVVEKVNDRLKKEGFRARQVPYPYAGGAEPQSLLCVLTPAIEEAGSPSDRANGKARKMILVVLTISDPATGKILAERRYYSGADVRPQKKP